MNTTQRGLLDIQTPYFRGKMSQNVLMTGRRYEKATYTPEVRSRKGSPCRDGEQVKDHVSCPLSLKLKDNS